MAANLGLVDTAAETLKREAIQEYVNFLDDSADDKVYLAKVEKLIDNGDNRLIVNMNDLQKKLPHRASRLLSNFAEEIVFFEDAAKEMVTRINAQFAKDNFMAVGFEGTFGSEHVNPRSLKSQFLGNLVCCEGIVTKVSSVHPVVSKSVHFCPATKKTLERTYADLTSYSAFPTSNIFPTEDENKNPLETEFGMSSFVDSQTFTIQEFPECAPAGQIPLCVDVFTENDLADRVKPGDRVRIVGLYRVLPNKQQGFSTGSVKSIIIANNIILLSKEVIPDLLPENITNIRKLSKRNDEKSEDDDEGGAELPIACVSDGNTRSAILKVNDIRCGGRGKCIKFGAYGWITPVTFLAYVRSPSKDWKSSIRLRSTGETLRSLIERGRLVLKHNFVDGRCSSCQKTMTGTSSNRSNSKSNNSDVEEKNAAYSEDLTNETRCNPDELKRRLDMAEKEIIELKQELHELRLSAEPPSSKTDSSDQELAEIDQVVTKYAKKGAALLINQQKFDVPTLSTRIGSDVATAKLLSVLQWLGFTCSTKENLLGKEIVGELRNFLFSNACKFADFIIISLASHGNELGICGRDGDVVLEADIMDQIRQATHLRGTEVLLIYNSCRGVSENVAEDAGEVSVDGILRRVLLPEDADILVAHATVKDYVSYGSRYIDALCEEFVENANKHELHELLLRVNARVSDKTIDEETTKIQVAEFCSSLRKRIRFQTSNKFPSFGESVQK